eukprot:scaffold32409_cov69-Phaeocystis_antarctica.AAC.1
MQTCGVCCVRAGPASGLPRASDTRGIAGRRADRAARARARGGAQPRTYASPERENGAPAARAAPADERGQVEELKVKGIRGYYGSEVATRPLALPQP